MTNARIYLVDGGEVPIADLQSIQAISAVDEKETLSPEEYVVAPELSYIFTGAETTLSIPGNRISYVVFEKLSR